MNLVSVKAVHNRSETLHISQGETQGITRLCITLPVAHTLCTAPAHLIPLLWTGLYSAQSHTRSRLHTVFHNLDPA